MDLTGNLQAIGFTEYEARVYLALLEQHPATGYQLSRDAGIPRSMVYEALGRLETRGAVLSSVDKRATHYRPVPPDTLLDRFAKEHSIRIDELRRGLNRAFEPRDEDRLWTIEGSGAVLAFSGGILYHRLVYLILFFILIIGTRMLLQVPTSNLAVEILIFLLLLFVSCMLLHNELYKLRPHAQFLSSFYLMVAVGGAIGGIIVTLIAPLIFSTGYWELQWGLIASGILMVIIIMREQKRAPMKRRS